VLLNGGLGGPRAHAYPVGRSPRAVAFDGQSVWVTNFLAGTLSQLAAAGCAESSDPCGASLNAFDTGTQPGALAYDGNTGTLWVAGALPQFLIQFDVNAGVELGRTPLPNVPSALLLIPDTGEIWTANDFGNNVTHVAADGSVIDSYPAGQGPIALAFDGRSLWVASEDNGSLIQIDPLSGAQLNTYPLGGNPRALAYDGAFLWAALTNTDEVVKVDPASGAVAARVAVGDEPVALLYDGASLWTADQAGDTVTRVDPASARTLATINVPGAPYALDWAPCGSGCGDLWVVGIDADTVSRVRVEGR
jgi:DNA-binding beta-propeller fold protein YncE